MGGAIGDGQLTGLPDKLERQEFYEKMVKIIKGLDLIAPHLKQKFETLGINQHIETIVNEWQT